MVLMKKTAPLSLHRTTAQQAHEFIIKMKYLTGLLLLITTVGSASEFSRGENLISSFTPQHPMFGNYQLYEKSDASSRSYLWKSKTFGNEDTYKLDIKLGLRSADLSQLQSILNKPGIENCKDFSSTNLDDRESNGYSHLTWETTCDNGNKTIYVLHKAIAGSDSLYLARKFWYRNVGVSTIKDWKKLFGEMYLCDTREGNHPCPEGYQLKNTANE